MANWKDVTSYSQSHPRGTVEPKSWELAGSSPRIVVTRYRGAPGWYLRTEGLDLVHLGEDLERAKAEAVRLVRERLTRMLDSLPPSDPWLPIADCPRPVARWGAPAGVTNLYVGRAVLGYVLTSQSGGESAVCGITGEHFRGYDARAWLEARVRAAGFEVSE